jgi:peptidoglycan/xylan/chitin deacetylase (PgdA/CDA1 family)
MADWGPDGQGSALTVSFDNLGEASELESGGAPAGRTLGAHPSVTEVLPRLLDELDGHALRATFFVEAINCELYPDAVREIAARGHELGHHGFRHERWADLSPQRETEILRRGITAFAELGIAVAGFRPPGGELTPVTRELLREHGLCWVSPVGEQPSAEGGLAELPFRWPDVDAYHVLPHFAGLRARHGDPREPLDPPATGRRLLDTLDALARDGGQRTLILHPFVALQPGMWEQMAAVLARAGELARAGTTWVGPGGPLAERLLAG